MELRYPILIFIIIFAIICYFLLAKRREKKYITGSKIANTHYIKSTNYYQQKIKEFNVIKYLLFVLFGISILTSTILISRLTKIETVNNDQYNRDIFLCMDVSRSVNDLNLELVESLKATVDKLHGERFGISIFNSSSVILVPLTEDYDYVQQVLDTIKKSIKANNTAKYGKYTDDDYIYMTSYIITGTTEGSSTRGSSLIGDGLASCVYSFSNPEEERTRIIIFSTDNGLAGNPIVTLDKAAKIAKSKGIKVFGIGTKLMAKADKTEYKNAMEKNGGKFYEQSTNTVNDIVDDIEKTSKSLLKNQYETKKIDIPQIPFIVLVFSILGIVIISKKVIS